MKLSFDITATKLISENEHLKYILQLDSFLIKKTHLKTTFHNESNYQ